MTTSSPSHRRALPLVSAAFLLVESAALIIILVTSDHLVLSVTVDLPGATTRTELARLDIGLAAVVLCLTAAVFRILEARRPTRDLRSIEYGLIAPVTVFLVARLNGIEDVGALVLVYAATSAMVLFTMLQDRVDVRRGHPMLALCFGAAVGIVPWGVIAFHQVGAGLVGDAVPVGVRVLTLVMLAFAAAFAVTQWRERRPSRSVTGERTHLLLVTASTSVFAWFVVLSSAGLG